MSLNVEVARLLYEIGELYALRGDVFRSRAYQRAAQRIESLTPDVQEVYDRGALAEIPDWRAYNVMGSYQFPQGTVTAQYAWGKGNQRGNWTEPEDPGEATDYDGYSVFGEYRFGPHWRVIGGFDDFQRSPGASDLGFTRLHGGVGYDFGDQNVLVFDLDRRNWDDAELATDTRYQVVMQVKF